MAKVKKSRFRPLPGFERIPGSARRYKILATGKSISRNKYIELTEGYKHPSVKAAVKKRERLERGERQPMKRYDAIVERYRLYRHELGLSDKVKGDSHDAIKFRKDYHSFTTTKSHSGNAAERKRHYQSGVRLGVIKGQMDDEGKIREGYTP